MYEIVPGSQPKRLGQVVLCCSRLLPLPPPPCSAPRTISDLPSHCPPSSVFFFLSYQLVPPHLLSASLCFGPPTKGALPALLSLVPVADFNSARGQVDLPDVDDIVGLGLHRPGRAVTVFTYCAATSTYNAFAWQILSDPRTRGARALEPCQPCPLARQALSLRRGDSLGVWMAEVSLLGANMEPRDITALASGSAKQEGEGAAAASLYGGGWWQAPSWGQKMKGGCSSGRRSPPPTPWRGKGHPIMEVKAGGFRG